MIPLFLDMSSGIFGQLIIVQSETIQQLTDAFIDSIDQPPVGETRACKDCKRMVFRSV